MVALVLPVESSNLLIYFRTSKSMITQWISLRRCTLILSFVGVLTATVLGQSLAVAPTTSLSSSERELSESVRTLTIREIVTALSADDMQGRGTAQPGGDNAAQFLADKFAKVGLKPLGDKGSYLQSIRFR